MTMIANGSTAPCLRFCYRFLQINADACAFARVSARCRGAKNEPSSETK
jgi:hypothetical protein